MWYEAYNTIYGRTSNAYDSRRMVGGSSGNKFLSIFEFKNKFLIRCGSSGFKFFSVLMSEKFIFIY